MTKRTNWQAIGTLTGAVIASLREGTATELPEGTALTSRSYRTVEETAGISSVGREEPAADLNGKSAGNASGNPAKLDQGGEPTRRKPRVMLIVNNPVTSMGRRMDTTETKGRAPVPAMRRPMLVVIGGTDHYARSRSFGA